MNQPIRASNIEIFSARAEMQEFQGRGKKTNTTDAPSALTQVRRH